MSQAMSHGAYHPERWGKDRWHCSICKLPGEEGRRYHAALAAKEDQARPAVYRPTCTESPVIDIEAA